MADLYSSSRTNYFKVKDRIAFEMFAEKYSCEIIEDDEGRVGLLPGDCNTFPNWDDDIEEELDFLLLISKHLVEGSVAIILEIGAEKLAYIYGWAEAIDHTGNRVTINISDIVDKARAKFGTQADITDTC